MDKKFCGNCGKDIQAESKFCIHCGASLQVHQTNEQQSNEPQLNQQPVNQYQTNQQPSSDKPFWKKYKWAFAGIAAIVIIFVIVQMQNNKPETVAEKFVEHISNADIDKAYDMIAINADEYFREDFRDMLQYYRQNKQEARRELMEEMNFKSFSVKDIERYGKSQVSVTGEVYMDDDMEEIYIDLIKEKGKWKVEDAY